MERTRRALTLAVVLGGLVPLTTACEGGAGGMCGALMKLVVGVGVAVGTYYLVEALK
jgi:hypothetical protein